MTRAARLDHPTRQAQIYETAARVFCENGYEKASMIDVALAMKMTKAGIYHHISSKEELLAAIIAYGMEVFERQVLDRVVTIRDPLERLRATLRGHLLLVLRDRPKEVTVILHESRALPASARARVNARKKRYIRFLEKTIRELVMRKIARPVDPSVAAFALLGMVNWTYQWYRPGGRMSEVALADAMTDFYLNGLLAAPARSGARARDAARTKPGAPGPGRAA
ncbi:MAG TPA: TetR/AcrR family transcriptional regulator [Patescibacteria group bacterium]|nr:TetR/AcrR family transcriptional regulator [Patescibacteria group bacterium]